MPHPPRYGDAPRRGPPAASAEEIARLMRRVGYASGILILWALAGVVAWLAPSYTVALGAVPLGLLALALHVLERRRPSHAIGLIASVAATLAAALAVAGHVLFWGGLHHQAFLVLALPGLKALAFGLVLLVVPLYAGLRLRALSLAWEASGSRARGVRALAEALVRDERDLLSAPPWGRAVRGLATRWIEGLAVPGLMLLAWARRALRPADRIHAEASSDALAAALREQGLDVEADARQLEARFPDGASVTIAPTRTVLPEGRALDVRGDVADARRLRRLLEGAASHALVFSWSAPAQRWERRLNALRREAQLASTLEERSLVMEELDRVRRALDERHLCGAERSILVIKERDARAALAHRMLSEPPGARREAHVLSQHGALMPDMARVVDAGGLGAVRRIAFVPYWVLPVRTTWGEQEVAVNATSGRLDRTASAALLETLRSRGPVLFLDVGTQAVFLPAPPPTAALLREMRAAGLSVSDEAATGAVAADILYVPYLATADGYVNGITGAPAPEMGRIVPVAPVG